MEQVRNKNNVFTIKLPAGNELYYALNNSKTIEICTNAQVKEELDNNKIIELNFGSLTIKLGDDFKHEQSFISSSYNIIEIEKKEHKKYKHSYTLTTHKDTLTSTYILPCLGLTKQQLSYDGFLVNAYLTNSIDRIALLYRYSTSEDYGRIEKELTKSKLFISLDNSIKGFDLVYMSVPKLFHKDISTFSQGSYSKLSDELKTMICSFHGLKEKDKIYQIMYKTDPLRKNMEKEWGISFEYGELYSKPDLNLETYNNE